MRRTSAGFVAVASTVLILSASACAPGYYSYSSSAPDTYMGFVVGVSNAPPPPRVYRGSPQFTVTVSSGVRVIESPEPDCDMFFYGGTYYLYSSSGYWYRCNSYDGSYSLVEVRRVPRVVLEVPAAHWRHHPGKGHGRGHDKDKHDKQGWGDRDD
jgi:hypothetical protein